MLRRATADTEYLTPPEVAELLRVHSAKVLRWIRSGELRAVDTADRGCTRPRYRVARVDLAAFIESRVPAPRPAVVRRRRKVRSEPFIEFIKA